MPESAEVLKLRDEMLDLRSCKTDHDLMNLVIAARMHGADGWLVRAASDDKAASEQWRRRRAIMLHAFLDEPPIAALQWPEGMPPHTFASLRNFALICTNRGVLARHWWRRFLDAQTREDAYASFTLFTSCADRRAFAWTSSDMAARLGSTELSRVKRLHWRLNREAVLRAMSEKVKEPRKLSETLCGADRPTEWLVMDGCTFS